MTHLVIPVSQPVGREAERNPEPYRFRCLVCGERWIGYPDTDDCDGAA